VFHWANGDDYNGGFQAGKRHGRGNFVSSEGVRSIGTWSAGKPDGYLEVYENGAKRVERWKEGVYMDATEMGDVEPPEEAQDRP
jgi:hypothetical protein